MPNPYVDDLWRVFGLKIPGNSDLCCYFFEKARAQIESGNSSRAGLLATNSIRGGANRTALNRINETGAIFEAWSDQPWILNGASVRISIVMFDNGTEIQRRLDARSVSSINGDLTATMDITFAGQLFENREISFIGDQKSGSFDVDEQKAKELLSAPVNPNRRPNSDVLVPWVNGIDIVRRPLHRWIIDFGVETSLDEAALYEAPFRYVEVNVLPTRSTANRKHYRDRWWIHGETRPGMRRKLQGLGRFVGVPRIAKHRVFAWIEQPTLPDCQVVVFAREDDYFFGVLHSRAHEIWSLRMGTSLEDRPRYTPTTCFETFPFPWPPGAEPVDDPRVQAIAAAAKELDEKRRAWLDPEGASEEELKKRTLTNLYNQRPTWLQHLHAALDRAVWDAYGWPGD